VYRQADQKKTTQEKIRGRMEGTKNGRQKKKKKKKKWNDALEKR
jgi:hypothetical protein